MFPVVCQHYYLAVVKAAYYHLQPKLSDKDFLNSALKKAYMKGFSALLQYKRMIDECLIRIGTFKIESINQKNDNKWSPTEQESTCYDNKCLEHFYFLFYTPSCRSLVAFCCFLP